MFFFQPNVKKLLEESNVQGLMRALNYQKDEGIISSAANALGHLAVTGVRGCEEAVGPMTEAISKARLTETRRVLLENIGLLIETCPRRFDWYGGHRLNIPVLVSCLRDQDLKEHFPLSLNEMLNPYSAFRDYTETLVSTLIELGDHAVEPLLDVVREEITSNPRVAVESLKILTAIGSHRVVEPLMSILNPNIQLKSDALKEGFACLERIDRKQAQAHALSLLTSVDTQVRLWVANYLKEHGWTPQEEDQQLVYYVALRDPEGCRRLGKPAVKELMNQLECLSDKERPSIMLALEAAGAEAPEPILEAVEDPDTDSVIRSELIQLLGKIGNDRAVQVLVRAMREYPDSLVELYALRALGEIGGPDAKSVLMNIFKTSEKHNHLKTIARQLHKLGHIPEEERLRVQYYCYLDQWEECLASGSVAVDPIMARLREDKDCSSEEAIQAIAEIGGPVARQVLVAFHEHLKKEFERCARTARNAETSEKERYYSDCCEFYSDWEYQVSRLIQKM